MDQVLLLLVVALTVAAVVFGVTVLVSGRDPGLVPAEPDGRAVPLPAARPLAESDVGEVRFDTALRGYRMAQVDHAMRRAAYDIGYKSELIGVLEAEVAALREGRTADADALRRAREQAAAAAEPSPQARGTVPVGADRADAPGDTDVVVAPIPAFAGPTVASAAKDATPAGSAAATHPGPDRAADRPDADRATDRTGADRTGEDDDAVDRAGEQDAAVDRADGGDAAVERAGAGDGTTRPAGDSTGPGPVVGSESK
ncbi:DivIVA domain-containing protein [Micromonospora sp. LOL_025]|uniref:DivIVA domain-containing protein n=1 Tax=Micromonospora sp. LOL_025 TaxID=3345413 RepID=UPI003A89EFD9